jgi:hypothetical protein
MMATYCNHVLWYRVMMLEEPVDSRDATQITIYEKETTQTSKRKGHLITAMEEDSKNLLDNVFLRILMSVHTQNPDC